MSFFTQSVKFVTEFEVTEMKKSKKILSLVLVFALTLSLMSVGVFAASASDSQPVSAASGDDAHTQGLITLGLLLNKLLQDANKSFGNNDGNNDGNNGNQDGVTGNSNNMIGSHDGQNGNNNGNDNANGNIIGSEDGGNGNNNGNDNTVNIGSLFSIVIGNPADTLAQSNLVTALSGLVKAGTLSQSALRTMLSTLNGSGTMLSKLSSLLKILRSNGLLGNTMYDKLLAQLGGTDISDENTPLAGDMLNSTDHIAYVQGVGGGRFNPDGSMTRAAAAQMLYNLLTSTSREMYYSTSSSFSDVPSGAWYCAAVSTLANAGVIDGYTNGTFGPNKPITRAEFIKLVVAMYGVDDSATASYTDLKAGNWAYPYIATATCQRLDHRLHQRQLRPHQKHGTRRGCDLYEPCAGPQLRPELCLRKSRLRRDLHRCVHQSLVLRRSHGSRQRPHLYHLRLFRNLDRSQVISPDRRHLPIYIYNYKG
jgi:hypothetical protein